MIANPMFVDVMQFPDNNDLITPELRGFLGGAFLGMSTEGWAETAKNVIRLKTQHGVLTVRPGDWLVRWQVMDEYYFEVMDKTWLDARFREIEEEPPVKPVAKERASRKRATEKADQ